MRVPVPSSSGLRIRAPVFYASASWNPETVSPRRKSRRRRRVIVCAPWFSCPCTTVGILPFLLLLSANHANRGRSLFLVQFLPGLDYTQLLGQGFEVHIGV